MSYKPKILNISEGGTSASTLTGILTGNGTSAITASTVTQNGVLYGGASNSISSLGVAASGTILAGATGTNPSFSATPSVTSISFGGTALSAYQEGTFTPSITGSGSNPSVGYTTATGRYTKTGDRVDVDIVLVLNSYSGGSGNAQIVTLPFTNVSTTQVGNVYCDNVTFGSVFLVTRIPSSSTTLFLIKIATGAVGATLATTGFAATSQVRISTTFET